MTAAAHPFPRSAADGAAREAFIASCRDEVEALKPGNVHVFSDGHGMTVDHFLRSAQAAAAPLCAPRSPVGARIQQAVEASFACVNLNTNLGIILLCAPIAAAAEICDETTTSTDRRATFRARLERVLRALTQADAEMAFAAILRASPGGLGAAARHDVRAPAQASLLDAMREAAGRDRIASQYASGYADVFGAGLGALDAARKKGLRAPWLATAVFLEFLANFPDSHIARKFGEAAARATQAEAAPWLQRFAAAADPAGLMSGLLSFDNRLKAAGRNPGTSADLTVATLFLDRLIELDCARQ